jgi:hypothetical protein
MQNHVSPNILVPSLPTFATRCLVSCRPAKSRRRRQGQSGCGLFELEITAPGGHVIGPGDPRYSKQDDYKLIIIDAAGFEVRDFNTSSSEPT